MNEAAFDLAKFVSHIDHAVQSVFAAKPGRFAVRNVETWLNEAAFDLAKVLSHIDHSFQSVIAAKPGRFAVRNVETWLNVAAFVCTKPFSFPVVVICLCQPESQTHFVTDSVLGHTDFVHLTENVFNHIIRAVPRHKLKIKRNKNTRLSVIT